MSAASLRPEDILATHDRPLPAGYYGLTAADQAHALAALAGFLADHPTLPPLMMPMTRAARLATADTPAGTLWIDSPVSTPADVPEAVGVAMWAQAGGVPVRVAQREGGGEARLSAEITLADGIRLTVQGTERLPRPRDPRQRLDDLLRATFDENPPGDPT